MHSLLAVEDMSAYDYQKQELFSVNALSKSLKSIRQYLTTRQSDEKTTLTYFFAHSEEVNAETLIFMI